MAVSSAPDYQPLEGDIISFSHRSTGRMDKCIVGEITDDTFILSRMDKKSGVREASAFIDKYHVIQTVYRFDPKVRKIKLCWQPPIINVNGK